MREIIKKSFILGLGAASLTKTQAEKVIKELVKKNAVTVKEGREMLNRVKKAAGSEGKRVKKFAEQEARRIAVDLGVLSKNQIGKIRKNLKSIDRELSKKGKKALKQIMGELSK